MQFCCIAGFEGFCETVDGSAVIIPKKRKISGKKCAFPVSTRVSKQVFVKIYRYPPF